MLRPAGPFSVAGLEWLSAFDLFRYAIGGGGGGGLSLMFLLVYFSIQVLCTADNVNKDQFISLHLKRSLYKWIFIIN